MTLGYVLRGAHFWLAHIAVFVVIVLFFRALLAKAYQPRTAYKVVWLVALLLLTGLLWFSGILLPWDSLLYWLNETSARIGIHWTLLRFYLLHVVFLPVLTLAVLIGYIRRVRKDGMTPLPAVPASSL